MDHWVGTNVQRGGSNLWGLEHNHDEQDMQAVVIMLVECLNALEPTGLKRAFVVECNDEAISCLKRRNPSSLRNTRDDTRVV